MSTSTQEAHHFENNDIPLNDDNNPNARILACLTACEDINAVPIDSVNIDNVPHNLHETLFAIASLQRDTIHEIRFKIQLLEHIATRLRFLSVNLRHLNNIRKTILSPVE